MAGYDLIQTDDELARLVARLRDARVRRLAIDVEGENNLHRYGIHVALIQLFDGVRGFIVDPLALRGPRRAEAAAGKRALGAGVVRRGQRPALLPACAGHPAVADPGPRQWRRGSSGRHGGLQALTGEGGSARAKDRFQRANWLRRPLSPALLDYAISDVLHLFSLADALMEELEDKGLDGSVSDEEPARRRTPSAPGTRTANFTRIPGFNRLSRAERRFARVLWYARELYGRAHDMPPGKRGLQAGHEGDHRQGPAARHARLRAFSTSIARATESRRATWRRGSGKRKRRWMPLSTPLLLHRAEQGFRRAAPPLPGGT